MSVELKEIKQSLNKYIFFFSRPIFEPNFQEILESFLQTKGIVNVQRNMDPKYVELLIVNDQKRFESMGSDLALTEESSLGFVLFLHCC